VKLNFFVKLYVQQVPAVEMVAQAHGSDNCDWTASEHAKSKHRNLKDNPHYCSEISLSILSFCGRTIIARYEDSLAAVREGQSEYRTLEFGLFW
jgi:hypothetical protein